MLLCVLPVLSENALRRPTVHAPTITRRFLRRRGRVQEFEVHTMEIVPITSIAASSTEEGTNTTDEVIETMEESPSSQTPSRSKRASTSARTPPQQSLAVIHMPTHLYDKDPFVECS